MPFARILWLLVLLQATQADRTSIIAHRSDPPIRNFQIIYYDDAFLFAGRDFGGANDPRGHTEPGLFVHSKQANRWVQITSISTAGGRFGKSTEIPSAEVVLYVKRADLSAAFTR